jgi:hypothetical protein
MYKELLDVNQGTMDSYINTLISGTVNQVSKNQVMREIEIKANKLNKIVDKSNFNINLSSSQYFNNSVQTSKLNQNSMISNLTSNDNDKKTEEIPKQVFNYPELKGKE